MTEREIRNKVIDTAKKYFGIKEGSAEHKKILSTYNNHKPLARNYVVQVNDAWCATFVSAIGILCGYTDIMPTECGCGQMIQLYSKIGRFIERDDYVPDVADIIMYDWDDTKGSLTDCTGWPEHVGYVAAVNGSTLTILEGNKNNSVEYRTISVNSRYIRGYCVPDYASKATKAETSSSAAASKPAPANTAAVDPACSFSKAVAGTYKVTASMLNVRSGAGTLKKILCTIPKGTAVQNYGYYTTKLGTKWLYIQFVKDGKTYTGYASSKYLKK